MLYSQRNPYEHLSPAQIVLCKVNSHATMLELPPDCPAEYQRLVADLTAFERSKRCAKGRFGGEGVLGGGANAFFCWCCLLLVLHAMSPTTCTRAGRRPVAAEVVDRIEALLAKGAS